MIISWLSFSKVRPLPCHPISNCDFRDSFHNDSFIAFDSYLGVPHRRALRNFKKTNRQIQRLSYKGVTIPCKLVPLPSVCTSIPQLLYVSPKWYSVIIECRNFTPYWTFFSWLILDHPRITPFQILIVTFGNFWLLTETCNILIIANSRFFEECILSFSLAHP